MSESPKNWSERTAFAGLGWASDHHDVVVVDGHGPMIEDFRFDDTADGGKSFRKKLSPYPHAAVAMETSSGATGERLLQAGYAVYPVNPHAAKGYGEGQAPRGTKSDRFEAWSLADALRREGGTWPPLNPNDPLTAELRLLCREEIALMEQRPALIGPLRAAPGEYYPAAVEAFEDWRLPSAWALVEAFPTPDARVQGGRRQGEKFLHTHKLYRPDTYEKRLSLLAQAQTFCGSPPTTQAQSMLAVAVAGQLGVLESHLDKFREGLRELLAQHPHHDLFGSLPGAGEKLAPRLLAELGDDRERFDSPEALQCYAGTAAVSYPSGQIKKGRFRRACQKVLPQTVPLWANLSRTKCPWAEAYDPKKGEEGQSQACALRCLGQRWLKILWKMWQSRTSYDAELHQRHQLQHGSWVLGLIAPPVGSS